MAKMNWSKVSSEARGNQAKKRENRRLLRAKVFKNSSNWNTYRNKNFYIGERLIYRYRPDKNEIPDMGIVFNCASGCFEVWKDGARISSLAWKVGQAALKKWVLVNAGLEL